MKTPQGPCDTERLVGPCLDSPPISELSLADCDRLQRRFVADRQINWKVGLAYCEARADRLCAIAAEEFGVELGKIWAYSAVTQNPVAELCGERFTLYLNREKTQRTDWNFHVAPMACVPADPSGSAMRVFDPVLFDTHESAATWKALFQQSADLCSFDITSRLVVEPQGLQPASSAMHKSLQSRVVEGLAASWDHANPVTAAAYENWQLGRWVDDLADRQPEQCRALKQRLDPAGRNNAFFRHWWGSFLTGEAVLQGLDERGYYFDIPADELMIVFADAEPWDYHFLIKTCFVHRVARFLEHLERSYWQLNDFSDNARRAREWGALSLAQEEGCSLVADWVNPFGHLLWRRFDAWVLAHS